MRGNTFADELYCVAAVAIYKTTRQLGSATQWLRGEGTQHFNFSGYVVSDQGCVHECAVRRAGVPPAPTCPIPQRETKDAH